MKLQVTQENLNRALSAVARIASSRSSLPILANVAVKTTNNRLSVAATNLDIAITYYIGAKITQEGSTTLPAHLTQDFIASLPSGTIDMKLDDNKLKVSAGQYSSVINTISADDFPTMPEINNSKTLKLSAGDFKSALNQVLVAAGRDETRPVLTGVFMVGSDKLTIAATDSYRLAEKTLKSKLQIEPLIIPANALSELLRILPDETQELTINYNDQQISFSTDDIDLVARLIDGKYPPYQNLIPTKFTTSAVVEREQLANIVKVSSLFARENAGSVTLNLDSGEQKLSIHSIASQLGENTSSSDAKVTGDGSITLNSRYITDALNTLSASEIFLGFNGKLEPVVLRNNSGDDYTHIIMPLKS